ncbi:hypothetical protein V6N12_065816 [Hibiscus sabdariffa]|uniref:DUF4219 domain-containing protein n=1 Tax=Hibiscus sabdariffa TaxID=183260 RepID=A0ABR2G9S4_9ROSI
MASTFDNFFMEGGKSISKPPFFNGVNYPYWKNRMMHFIQSTDYTIWDVMLDGPSTPIKRERDCLLPKQKHKWTDEDRNKLQLNAKAMHILFCAVGPVEYARMSSCSSAKEIWNKLEDSKNTAIIKAKNLKTLKLDELMGSLLTHELMGQGKKEDEKKKEESKEVEKKKVGIALKAFTFESGSSEKEEDEEMTMLAKSEPKEKKMDQIICHECKKLRHIKFDCPQLKKKSFGKKKHKAHVGTWIDEESSAEEEVAIYVSWHLRRIQR